MTLTEEKSNMTSNNHECQLCGKTFLKDIFVKYHISKVHSEDGNGPEGVNKIITTRF